MNGTFLFGHSVPYDHVTQTSATDIKTPTENITDSVREWRPDDECRTASTASEDLWTSSDGRDTQLHSNSAQSATNRISTWVIKPASHGLWG